MTHYASIDPKDIKKVFEEYFSINKITHEAGICCDTACRDCMFFGFGCNRRKKKWLDQPVFDWDEADPENEENKNDPVYHPSYYTDGKIEVIDYIKDKGLGFCLGNAVKYISRAGKKDPEKEIEDLRKAAWYINRRIEELLEKENGRK